jgi:hypothetical protein
VLETFLSLPLWLIILISVTVPVCVTVPIVRAIFASRIEAEGDDTEGLVAVFGFIGTAFTLLLAFIIVNVWSDQVAAQDVLFDEMVALKTVIDATQEFDPVMAPELQTVAIEYLESVRQYEVDQAPPVGGDPRTEAHFEELVSVFANVEIDIESAPGRAAAAQILLEEVKNMVDNRESRVNRASGSLDGMTTMVCVLLALLTVVSMALLPTPSRRWIKWVQSVGVAVTVGLVMSLVFYIASDNFSADAKDEQIRQVEAVLTD